MKTDRWHIADRMRNDILFRLSEAFAWCEDNQATVRFYFSTGTDEHHMKTDLCTVQVDLGRDGDDGHIWHYVSGENCEQYAGARLFVEAVEALAKKKEARNG